MCSNYKIPKRTAFVQLGIEVNAMDPDIKSHVYPLYPAPIIVKEFDLDFGKFGLIPKWAKDTKFGTHTYNARTETVAEKPSFRHAWTYSKFCLVLVQEFYEPKYIDGKANWYTIKREDDHPFTVAAIYDDAVIDGIRIRSFSMLTINSDNHPFMKQFHAPADEKRSIIIIPEEYRNDWLNVDRENAHEYFFEMRDEFVTFPRDHSSDEAKQSDLF